MSKWIEGKLRDLVEVNPTVKLIKGEIYPFVSMDVIQPFYKPVEAKEEREFKSGGAKFENGDTLFARITPCLENGKIAQVKNLKNGKGFGSTEFIVLRGKEGITDTDFVYYLVTNKSFRENAERLMVGTSGRQRVDKQQFEDQIISIPDLETQKRISSILGSIDKKIELNVEMNKTLEEMAMTLYKHWFVDFGPFQDGEFVESELGMIPKGWEVSNVGSVTNIFDSLRVPLSNKEREKRKGIYPYYGATSLMDYVDDYIFDGTYLLVGEDGSVMKEDGTPYTQYVSGKFWVNNHAHVLQGTNGVSTEWLKVFFDNCNVAPYVTGAVQPKINQKNLKSIPFLLPPQNVRQEFNKNIKNLYEKILINNKENVQLETIRNYLLPRLLSGEIDVSQAEKQVEEVL
ncbi:restriction endonuclease subunit S [Geobacillus sp. B4113_201601]|uniref:restriction endonuclease subunit S n=1 Tax=Geobacillus sp. B4113_201601 TaxID=1586290 RepID=UPI000784BE22|nr:restriction endonuclease subunit S [Geobacillus sp. B4113_201601]KYD29051.1 Type I restriction-modification system, specificity subunit S [Geobacillus sp. B4113_201601]